MDYFFTLPGMISGGRITIAGDEFNHLVHVMRKRTGDEIRVVDGCGTAYDVRLDEFSKRSATGSILRSEREHHEVSVDITIAVGILKNPSKFDFLVEKVTELGVRKIVPLLTDRTIPDHARVDRWQKLALAGMKQAGRSRLPQVEELRPLITFLHESGSVDYRLIAHEIKLTDSVLEPVLRQPVRSVSVLIGPEGGFTDEEVSSCRAMGWIPMYLGERRLRTETAAIVAVDRIIRGSQPA